MFKHLLLALCVVAGLWSPTAADAQAIGGANTIVCNKTAVFSGVTGVTSLIAGVAGKTISICGWHVTSNSATAATFQITSGTQTTTACDTGTVNITPALSILNTAPSADHIDFAITSAGTPGIGGSAVSSPAICVNPSITGISGLVYYSQY